MKINKVDTICSMLVLGELRSRGKITKKHISDMSKKEIAREITELNKKNSNVNLFRIKTVMIATNEKRLDYLFSPFRFAYSYHGNEGKVNVFYLNFPDNLQSYIDKKFIL